MPRVPTIPITVASAPHAQDDDQEPATKYLTAVITAQPVSVTAAIGDDVSFTFSYSAVIPAEFTLQWQVLNEQTGNNWRDLVETTGFYEGVATTTLHVKQLDNFLANWPRRLFRCKLLFAGSMPTFTNAVSITIPIFTNWNQYLGALGYAAFPNTCTTDQIPAPVVTGLGAGPLTYLWSQVGGSAMTISSATAASPFFQCTALGPGVAVSIWKCTISNGTQSVSTDNIYVAVSFYDTLFVGSFSVPGVFGNTFFAFNWLTFLYPPNPLVEPPSTVIVVALRCSAAPGFTLHASTFDPTTMQYVFSYDETTPSNPGCSQFALFRCKFQNPTGSFGYFLGQFANPAFKGFVISPFPMG